MFSGGLMRKVLHRIGVVIATVLLANAGSSFATASPASSDVTCGPSAPNRDPYASQIINPVRGCPGPAMRTGPGLNCNILVRPPWGTWVPMNCYRVGDWANGVNTWTAVHYAGYFGWVNDYYLSGRGSNYSC